MNAKSNQMFQELKRFRQVLLQARSVAVVSLSVVFLLSTRANAGPIVNFFLEFPTVYIQAGLEVDPDFGSHPFIIPVGPTTYWANLPAALTVDGSTYGHVGSSEHIYAPHPDDTLPSTTWSYDIAVQAPSGYGARETRIRETVPHPSGEHVDAYMGVVGALGGTVPGASRDSRRVVIGGSIGRHMDKAPPPGPQPIFGGGDLEPRSGQPSPINLDFPVGELLTIVDPISSQLTMMAIVDGLPGNMISNVFLRQGPNGPIMMDLRPQMQLHHFDAHASLLAIPDAVIPPHIVQMIGAGNAYVSVEFPTTIHPDGAIEGAISLLQEGDHNRDGMVDAADYIPWRKGFDDSDFGVGIGDDNGDGFVNKSDYGRYHRGFGTEPLRPGEWELSPEAPVPEPTSTLLLMSAAGLGNWKRRRIA